MLFQMILSEYAVSPEKCGDVKIRKTKTGWLRNVFSHKEKDQLNKNKKERMRSYKEKHRPFAPMDGVVRSIAGRVSLCTLRKKWRKASLTVETAAVLPLFLFGCITMISFMDIYKLQTEHMIRLCEEAKTAGMYAYVLEGSDLEDITLPDVYSYKPIGGWISLPRVWRINAVTVHAWTGRDYGNSGQSDGNEAEPEEGMVYVAETGSVYHVDPDCTYLKLSIKEVTGSSVGSKVNRYGQHYGACEICSRHQSPGATVYITDTGTAYHNQATCSGLKRTVYQVSEASVEGMRACSRCGKNH